MQIKIKAGSLQQRLSRYGRKYLLLKQIAQSLQPATAHHVGFPIGRLWKASFSYYLVKDRKNIGRSYRCLIF